MRMAWDASGLKKLHDVFEHTAGGPHDHVEAEVTDLQHPHAAHDHDGTYVPVAAHPHANDHASSHTHASHTGIGAGDHHSNANDHSNASDHTRAHTVTATLDHTFPGGSTFLRADGVFASPPGGTEAFPVGAIYLNVTGTNPGTELGYGTWSAIAGGRVLIGQTGGDADFDTAEETGGSKTTTLTTTELPAHVHGELAPSSAAGGALKFGIDTNASGSQAAGLDTASAGSGSAFSIMNPYFVVYVWKRTA